MAEMTSEGANAGAGIDLSQFYQVFFEEAGENLEAMERIAVAMPGQFSSTAQDLARGKPSEIDHLNGFVVQRGASLGVPTPANRVLWATVRLMEKPSTT